MYISGFHFLVNLNTCTCINTKVLEGKWAKLIIKFIFLIRTLLKLCDSGPYSTVHLFCSRHLNLYVTFYVKEHLVWIKIILRSAKKWALWQYGLNVRFSPRQARCNLWFMEKYRQILMRKEPCISTET